MVTPHEIMWSTTSTNMSSATSFRLSVQFGSLLWNVQSLAYEYVLTTSIGMPRSWSALQAPGAIPTSLTTPMRSFSLVGNCTPRKVKQDGTYWYHSHSGFQEQVGVYGPLVIDAKEPEPFEYDREYVVMLTDWTDEDPASLMKTLKKQSDYYNTHKRTVSDFIHDVADKGWSATVADRKMWAEMKMNPTDIADVSGATYTYLMNGHAPNSNWTGTFKPGEKLRLRFINGSAMSYFDVRIPGLKMTVVAADGQYVKPVSVDEFRIATAETFDVIVEPTQDAYTLFAQSMDRSGYARGTLAVRPGLAAPVLNLTLVLSSPWPTWVWPVWIMGRWVVWATWLEWITARWPAWETAQCKVCQEWTLRPPMSCT